MGVARGVYHLYRDTPPFGRELHTKMLELEQEEQWPSKARVRAVLTMLCDQFGQKDPEVWLALVRLELEAGNHIQAAQVVCRGETNLDKELFQKFTILREKEGM